MAALQAMVPFDFEKSSTDVIKKIVTQLELVSHQPLNAPATELLLRIFDDMAGFGGHRVAYESLKRLSQGPLNLETTREALAEIEADFPQWKR